MHVACPYKGVCTDRVMLRAGRCSRESACIRLGSVLQRHGAHRVYVSRQAAHRRHGYAPASTSVSAVHLGRGDATRIDQISNGSPEEAFFPARPLWDSILVAISLPTSSVYCATYPFRRWPPGYSRVKSCAGCLGYPENPSDAESRRYCDIKLDDFCQVPPCNGHRRNGNGLASITSRLRQVVALPRATFQSGNGPSKKAPSGRLLGHHIPRCSPFHVSLLLN